VTNCDDCYKQEIEDLRKQVNLLTVELSAFGYCQDLKTQAISSASAVESDMENLILTLRTEDTAKWQKVFDDFSVGCVNIPSQYCEQIQTSSGSGVSACQLASGVCSTR